MQIKSYRNLMSFFLTRFLIDCLLCRSGKICNRFSPVFYFKLITWIILISKVWGLLMWLNKYPSGLYPESCHYEWKMPYFTFADNLLMPPITNLLPKYVSRTVFPLLDLSSSSWHHFKIFPANSPFINEERLQSLICYLNSLDFS